MPDNLILLTGASGYVGGRLLRALAGRRLRCLTRQPEYLRPARPASQEKLEKKLLARTRVIVRMALR